MSKRAFTVGHSNHSSGHFLELLVAHAVDAVADVRSSPYSRFAPQFNKPALQRSLIEADVQYVFLGRELGARSSDPDCYEHGRVLYDRLAQTDLFRAGLNRLTQGSQSQTVAIMCSEKDPLDCHRTLLVARALVSRGIAVEHILADGATESHEDSMLRLLVKTGQPPEDFFSTLEDRIASALVEQEARIAYVDKSLAPTSENS